jgi:hypothetical protein
MGPEHAERREHMSWFLTDVCLVFVSTTCAFSFVRCHIPNELLPECKFSTPASSIEKNPCNYLEHSVPHSSIHVPSVNLTLVENMLHRNASVQFGRFPYFGTAVPSRVRDCNYLFPSTNHTNTHRSLSKFIYGGPPITVMIAPHSFKLSS